MKKFGAKKVVENPAFYLFQIGGISTMFYTISDIGSILLPILAKFYFAMKFYSFTLSTPDMTT